MPRLCVVVLSSLLGLTLALPAAAQWKWRDQAGQTIYSDLPPPTGTADKDILLRPQQQQQQRRAVAAVPAASGASSARGVDPELESRRRKTEQDQVARNKAEEERVAAVRAENCQRARSYMRTLDDGVRVMRSNDKGEREIIDDKQRADETRRTREVIASDCKQ